MNKNQREQADFLYLLLAGLFVASLITCNLIANKFVEVPRTWLGMSDPFIISAGVLPYPITFLITDLLSEFYGRKRTNRVVIVGFFASLLTLLFLWLGGHFNAIEGSPISDEVYATTFGNAPLLIAGSMLAYLAAQLVDVRLFHFWKRITNGKHLWLRNNASTILSQLVDTTIVVSVVFWGKEPAMVIAGYVLHGWAFKALVAALDTPVIYGLAWIIRKKFNLKPAEEFNF